MDVRDGPDLAGALAQGGERDARPRIVRGFSSQTGESIHWTRIPAHQCDVAGPSFAPGGSGSSRRSDAQRAARFRLAADISARRDGPGGRQGARGHGDTAAAPPRFRAMTRARFRCPSLCRARVDELLRHHADFVFVD